MALWQEWWFWFGAALVLGILEMVAPVFVLLGFAIGAALIGVVLAVGVWPAGVLVGSLPLMAVLFAVLSLLAWLLLRQVFQMKTGQVKIWDKDIND